MEEKLDMSGEIDVGIKQHTFELPHHRRATIETGIKADIHVSMERELPSRDYQISEKSDELNTFASHRYSEDGAALTPAEMLIYRDNIEPTLTSVKEEKKGKFIRGSRGEKMPLQTVTEMDKRDKEKVK